MTNIEKLQAEYDVAEMTALKAHNALRKAARSLLYARIDSATTADELRSLASEIKREGALDNRDKEELFTEICDKRVCDICGKVMDEGYCIADGAHYYCSDECMNADISADEYDDLFEAGEACWTAW